LQPTKFKRRRAAVRTSRLLGRPGSPTGEATSRRLLQRHSDQGERGRVFGRRRLAEELRHKQIEKGIAALASIKAALLDQDKTEDKALIAKLWTEYYRVIPTSSGRKAPPPFDSLQIVGEKLKELEFWLRMGFGDMAELLENPIKQLWETPLQPTLSAACEP